MPDELILIITRFLNITPLVEYLQAIDPSDDPSDELCIFSENEGYESIYVWDLDLIKKIFRVISTFNTISEDQLSFMRKIIWARNWQTVASPSDLHNMESQRVAYENAHQPSWTESLMRVIFGKFLGFDRLFKYD